MTGEGALTAWVGLLVPVLWFGPVLVAQRWREREWLKLVDARAWRAGEESPYDEIRNARADWNVIRVIQVQCRERARLTERDDDPKVEQVRLRVRLAGRFLVGWIFFGLFPVAAVLSLPTSAEALLNGRPTPNLIPALVVLLVAALVAASFIRAYRRTDPNRQH